MRMFNNVKRGDLAYLKIGDRFFTFPKILGFESKGSISSTIKENLLLYYRKLLAFVVAVIV